jgi:hypothetical protein
MTAAADSAGRAWRAWFAWRPMLVYGYSEGVLWRTSRWVWLRRIEYRETPYTNRWLYRLPETKDILP